MSSVLTLFRILVIGMVFFGSYASLAVVCDLADLFMALLTITNLYAIISLSKFAYLALNDYRNQKQSGIKEPVFKAEIMPNQDGVSARGNEKEYLKTLKD